MLQCLMAHPPILITWFLTKRFTRLRVFSIDLPLLALCQYRLCNISDHTMYHLMKYNIFHWLCEEKMTSVIFLRICLTYQNYCISVVRNIHLIMLSLLNSFRNNITAVISDMYRYHSVKSS